MATYEYECVCGLVFTLFNVPMKDSSKQGKCPECEKMAKRKFSSVGIIIN